MEPKLTRRETIGTVVGAGAAALGASPLRAAPAAKMRMGVAAAAYGHRNRGGGTDPSLKQFRHGLDMLEHCHSIGAGGVQIGVGGWDAAFVKKVRDRRESLGMYLEGQIRLPRGEDHVERFASDVRGAGEAGATILRTAILGTRRYETFDTAEAFEKFKQNAWRSLTLAEPVVRRARARLAIENHKDWRVPEMVDLLKRLGSEYVGVCLDTGNSIALLEDPMHVVEAYAPMTFTVHLKDMGVQEYEDGFLLSEVPFGDGFLDLKRIVEVIWRVNPAAQMNLEMITRDPLKVPCLTEGYWATFAALPGADLARTLAMVRRNHSQKPLPHTSSLSDAQKVDFEEHNIRLSFDYARKNLGL